MSLAKVLSILFIFSNNKLLVSLIFSVVLFIYFSSDLYDFFSSTNFGFCLVFSKFFLGVRLGCLRFFLLAELRLYYYKLSS